MNWRLAIMGHCFEDLLVCLLFFGIVEGIAHRKFYSWPYCDTACKERGERGKGRKGKAAQRTVKDDGMLAMHDDWRAIALTVLQADPAPLLVTFMPNHACTLIPVLILPMVSAYSAGFSFLRRYWLIFICGLHVETVLFSKVFFRGFSVLLHQSGAEALVGHLHVAFLAAFWFPPLPTMAVDERFVFKP
ncbi:hypothetical protein OPV22_005659 [Ensete ventricosum]|uniref:Uncharacterized protein n=1 Tax=Ensete ventricosum TaxID=4639 RepID=A0AAV8RN28_ENSVE|nr:hypothetical protein OPV22_005659 [Ensete ventricosum]RWV78191.1 hypothetical protein GW17_00060873 [Ensete ventricosum]